jgi:hypothetical protein
MFALLSGHSVGAAAANPHGTFDACLQGLCCASARRVLLRGSANVCWIAMKKKH